MRLSSTCCNGHRHAVLGPGIAHRVAAVLHRYRSHLLVGHSELVLVPGGRHSVDAGHGISLGTVWIGGNRADGPVEMGGHGLDAKRQHPLVPAGFHRHPGLVKRRCATGTRVLDGYHRHLHNPDLLKSAGDGARDRRTPNRRTRPRCQMPSIRRRLRLPPWPARPTEDHPSEVCLPNAEVPTPHMAVPVPLMDRSSAPLDRRAHSTRPRQPCCPEPMPSSGSVDVGQNARAIVHIHIGQGERRGAPRHRNSQHCGAEHGTPLTKSRWSPWTLLPHKPGIAAVRHSHRMAGSHHTGFPPREFGRLARRARDGGRHPTVPGVP